MNNRLAIVGTLLLAASPALAQTVVLDSARRLVDREVAELPTRVVGRVAPVPLARPMPAGATGWRHAWPGIYWEARVAGDAVVLSFDDPVNEYRLLVDERPPIAIVEPGRAQLRVSGLGAGPHRLRLETVTEGGDKAGTFEGFYAAPAAALPAPPPAPRQIEFVGDSSMTGHGDRSTTTTCTPDEARLRTDTQAGYPALVARRLGADYEVNAMSGRGMVRNFDDFDEGHGLPAFYPYTLLDRTVPVIDPGWHPQLAVVRLFADFVTPLKPGERWPDDRALALDYARTLAGLVRTIHARTPTTAILVWWLDTAGMPDPRGRALIDAIRLAVTSDAHAAGVATIAFAPFPPARFDGSACDHHGSLADQARMADAMVGFLAAHPELWPAGGR